MHLSLKGSMDRQPLTDRLGDRLLAEYGGAAAAYSLRALNGNGDSVVRVRRASDNDEEDFTAEQIELGEMVNWVNSQTVPPLDIGVLTPEGRIPVPEGGTSIGIPAAAYSLRNLSTTYTGNVVDVRRSSDDAEDSFTATEVADGTLTDWVGVGNDGFVTQWYDQSGNDNHATQGTNASQPKIVDGGVLVSDGISFNGTSQQLAVAGNTVITASAAGTYSAFSVQTINTDEAGYLYGNGNNTTTGTALYANSDSTYVLTNGSDASRDKIARTLGKNLLSAVYASGRANLLVNATGTDAESGTYAFNAGTEDFTIGNRPNGTAAATRLNGSIREIIVYNSNQSANRTAIEANIGETYGITGIPAYDNTVDGFVETWYDQSGNGNDATQSVAAGQPKIVDGGSLVTGGLDFDGVDDSLIGTHNVTSAYNFFSVTTDEGSATSYIADTGSGSTNGVNYGRTVNSGGNRQLTLNHGGVSAVNATGFLVGTELISQSYDGTTINAFVDGSLVGTSVQGYIASGTVLSLGASGSAGAFLNGKMAEIILYPSDQSANRVAIETNINNQYDIY
jgi:hypothetical protein